MARIRTIKPEFWTDGKVVKLSAFARLLFIGTWNFARCDAGHLDDDPEALKLKVLPTDKVNPEKLVQELMAAGVIERHESEDGRRFLKIRRFTDHQKIDDRWATRCPYCSLPNSTKLTETRANSPQEGMGRDGKGKEEEKTPPAKPTAKDFWDELKANHAYRHVQWDIEIGKMRAWLSLPKNGKRQMSKAFVLNWINKIEVPLKLPEQQRRPETCSSPGCPRPWHIRREGKPLCAEHSSPTEPVQNSPPQSAQELVNKLAGSFGTMK